MSCAPVKSPQATRSTVGLYHTGLLAPAPHHAPHVATTAASASGLGAVWVARDLYRTEGPWGFMRGVSAGAPRVMAGSASQLTSYELMKTWTVGLSERAPQGSLLAGLTTHSWEVHVAASVISSAVSTTCFCPFDVISSRLYMPGGDYAGFWDCAIKTVRGEGWMALERGWLALYARTGPTSTLTLVLWELLRDKAGCS